jgi:nucleotide-binding universal stress UspA family protein
MKVLVGIDDPQSSQPILQTVIEQFDPTSTVVRLLRVVALPTFSVPSEMVISTAPKQQDQFNEARDSVERAANILGSAGFKVDRSVKQDDIRESIIDSAVECGADLILLGSHGRSGLQRFLLGSVAESVARHATCSVEIVRGPVHR